MFLQGGVGLRRELGHQGGVMHGRDAGLLPGLLLGGQRAGGAVLGGVALDGAQADLERPGDLRAGVAGRDCPNNPFTQIE